MTVEYKPSEIEKKWQDYWQSHQTFKTPQYPGDKKFYCLDMFPYPSGAGLHVGHPLGYTASDIYSRWKRMNGYTVLHPMGFDAFGLPAEQHAVSTGEHPAKITAENCQRYTQQLKKIGLSYDWERSISTCDSDYYKWTQWIFLKLFNSWFDSTKNKARHIDELPIPEKVRTEGALSIQNYQADHRLAYYADAMVNWCPALGTVLANEEVIDGKSERGGFEVVRKPMKQWMLRITKYADRLVDDLDEIDWPENIKEQQRNWIGKKKGLEIKFDIVPKEGESTAQGFITAFTTRPDTIFGVTFFVISTEHPAVGQITSEENKEKVAEYCESASRMSEFARTLEKRKKTGVFTGGYVINPASGEHVPVFIGDYVLMSYGTGAVMGVPAHDERDFEFARTFRLEIRPVLAPETDDLELLNAVCDGEIAWTGAGEMLPCAAQVFKDLQLEGKHNEEAKEKISAWLEKKGKGLGVYNYKLRDWLFSRQRYWGEPIPIVHWEDGTMTALQESELPLVLPQVEDYRPSETGESPLAKAEAWLKVESSNGGLKGRRETNTMPQWAGSCWYYLRFIDPGNSKAPWEPELEKAWMPVDFYVGGAEHAVLHLLYARFWHKVLFDLGQVSTNEPFQRLFNQGMVQAFAYKNKRGALVPSDEVQENNDGQYIHSSSGEILERITAKMSKSLRNVVTVDEVLDQYGADTFRMYLMFMGPLDSSRPWDPKAISGNFRFLKKVWSFVTAGKSKGVRDTVSESDEDILVKKSLSQVIKRVGEDIEGYRFNTAIAAMMEFLNEVGSKKVSTRTLNDFVSILSPFAPHISEELWQRLGHKTSVALGNWPCFEESLLVEETTAVVIQVNGKKRAIIEVSVSIAEEQLKSEVISRMSQSDYPVSEKDRFITVYRPGTKIPRLINVIMQN